jgi:hypothetical protein
MVDEDFLAPCQRASLRHQYKKKIVYWDVTDVLHWGMWM